MTVALKIQLVFFLTCKPKYFVSSFYQSGNERIDIGFMTIFQSIHVKKSQEKCHIMCLSLFQLVIEYISVNPFLPGNFLYTHFSNILNISIILRPWATCLLHIIAFGLSNNATKLYYQIYPINKETGSNNLNNYCLEMKRKLMVTLRSGIGLVFVIIAGFTQLTLCVCVCCFSVCMNTQVQVPSEI